MRIQSFIIITFLLIVSGAAQGIVRTDPTRFDVEVQQPGALIERTLLVQNHGDRPTNAVLEASVLEGEVVAIDPPRLDLAVGASQEVTVRIQLPQDASGGRHDVRLMVIEGDMASGDMVGARAALRIPIVFHVENLKLGGLNVADAGPGETGSVQAMVFNHLPHATDAVLHVVVRDGEHEVARLQGDPRRMAPEEIAFLDLGLARLPGGVYTVDAWVQHDGGVSNARSASYAVGLKSATVGAAVLETLPDGRHRISATVENTGTVPLEPRLSFRVADGSGQVQEFHAGAMALQPGESRTGSVVVRLEAGPHDVVPVLRWDDGGSEGPFSTVRAEGAPASIKGGLHPGWYVGSGLAVGALLALFLRRRRPEGP